MKIKTIQIGPVATVVTPGAFFMRGTVAAVLVIITIFGGKCHTTMITKRITSGSYKKIKKENSKFVGLIFPNLAVINDSLSVELKFIPPFKLNQSH